MINGGLAAGRLRDLVEIQTETRTPNGQGGFTIAWTTDATVRAEVMGLSGDEALKAGVERNIQQWRVTIHRRDEVTAKNRLLWRGQTLNIKAAMPDPLAITSATRLMCESGA